MESAITGATGTKLGENAKLNILRSPEINIDNGSGTAAAYLLLVADRPLTIVGAYIEYSEATDTAGAASATVQIGSTAGGVEIVAATALEVSKAIGARTDLTLVATGKKIAKNGFIQVTHTGIAATEAGKYHVVVLFTYDK